MVQVTKKKLSDASEEAAMEREVINYSLQKDFYMGHKVVNGLLVAYECEKARWLQYVEGEHLVIERPDPENAYIGIAIHHDLTLHFIKKLIVFVKVVDEIGRTIGEQQHFYHARPILHNYGRNWILPGDGYYDLMVRIEIPEEIRIALSDHGITERSVEVAFHHVLIHTGIHIS